MARPTLVARGDAPRSRLAVALPLVLLALTLAQWGCAPRAMARCPRGEFLYTERSPGRGQTLQERAVYACAVVGEPRRR